MRVVRPRSLLARAAPPLAGGFVFAGVVALTTAACSVSEGEGGAKGNLNVPDCWSGPFQLNPDFFAGVPYRRSLELRVQEGGDYTTYSDGMDILVRDIDAVLGDGTTAKPPRLGEALPVRIPADVTPPGVPLTPDPAPSLVDFAVYLQHTCKTQNVTLYAGTEALNADGTCDGAGSAPPACPTDATAAATASTPAAKTATSSITFTHLFNGNPDEPTASKRLTEASFDVYLADPREVCPGGFGPPPRCRGHLTGSFRFYFERGRPAQRFP